MSNSELDALLNSGRDILPENMAMMQMSKNADTDNFSTEVVEPTDPFNTHDIASSVAAQMTMKSQHLNLAATAPGVAMDQIMAYKNELAPLAEQLAKLKLPDTRVNVHNDAGGRPLKIEIPYDVKQYANDLNQAQYNRFMLVLLGQERMIQVRAASTKANQGTTPALWLNQQICVESKKPRVFTLSQDLPDSVRNESRLNLTQEQQEDVPRIIRACVGPTLFDDLGHIARANQIGLYTLFVLLVDLVLAGYKQASKVQTALSIWDDVTPPDEQRDHPTTAAEAVKIS